MSFKVGGALGIAGCKLLRAEASEAMLPELLRRQELERMERKRRVRIFLTPEEAAAALRSLSREVAGLTYGWASPEQWLRAWEGRLLKAVAHLSLLCCLSPLST